MDFIQHQWEHPSGVDTFGGQDTENKDTTTATRTGRMVENIIQETSTTQPMNRLNGRTAEYHNLKTHP